MKLPNSHHSDNEKKLSQKVRELCQKIKEDGDDVVHYQDLGDTIYIAFSDLNTANAWEIILSREFGFKGEEFVRVKVGSDNPLHGLSEATLIVDIGDIEFSENEED